MKTFGSRPEVRRLFGGLDRPVRTPISGTLGFECLFGLRVASGPSEALKGRRGVPRHDGVEGPATETTIFCTFVGTSTGPVFHRPCPSGGEGGPTDVCSDVWGRSLLSEESRPEEEGEGEAGGGGADKNEGVPVGTDVHGVPVGPSRTPPPSHRKSCPMCVLGVRQETGGRGGVEIETVPPGPSLHSGRPRRINGDSVEFTQRHPYPIKIRAVHGRRGRGRLCRPGPVLPRLCLSPVGRTGRSLTFRRTACATDPVTVGPVLSQTPVCGRVWVPRVPYTPLPLRWKRKGGWRVYCVSVETTRLLLPVNL